MILKMAVLHSHPFEVFALNLRLKYKGPELGLRMWGVGDLRRVQILSKKQENGV